MVNSQSCTGIAQQMQQYQANPPARREISRADLGLQSVVASEEEVREWIERHHGSEDWRGEYARRIRMMLRLANG